MLLTRDSSWTLVASMPIGFTTHHPQGMVKIGDTLLRLVGRGHGADEALPAAGGRLRPRHRRGRRATCSRSTCRATSSPISRSARAAIYHPGGIDYDGQNIWVPVAEYRPEQPLDRLPRRSRRRMKATEVFRFADHIGGIVHNTDDHTLHGVSWGSRRFYRWTLGRDGRVTNAGTPPEKLRTLNPSHYVDYQDCKYAGRRRMLCTGVTEMRQTPDAPPVPARRHRPRRSRRRPSAAPGAGAALDPRRAWT